MMDPKDYVDDLDDVDDDYDEGFYLGVTFDPEYDYDAIAEEGVWDEY